jgi:hypothetical protein
MCRSSKHRVALAVVLPTVGGQVPVGWSSRVQRTESTAGISAWIRHDLGSAHVTAVDDPNGGFIFSSNERNDFDVGGLSVGVGLDLQVDLVGR